VFLFGVNRPSVRATIAQGSKLKHGCSVPWLKPAPELKATHGHPSYAQGIMHFASGLACII
jgi:hypothetical protein